MGTNPIRHLADSAYSLASKSLDLEDLRFARDSRQMGVSLLSLGWILTSFAFS
jgi:hypothetical protein